MKPLLDTDKIEKSREFYHQIHQIQMEYLKYWQENTLWHWEFWLSSALAVVPWVLWFLFRKRGSEARLLLVGSFTMLVTSWLDFLGVVFGVWHYSGKLLPTIPSFSPWDFSLIPVITMLWLQFKPTLHPFLKAIIYSTFISFIGEPLIEWIGLYSSGQWTPFYSFPIYIVIYLVAYRISKAKTFNDI
ncbi:CBO0543 family protein [Halalkalibacter kiskunsagensis]|uniref:CBO0543 family protein n=1 Tax=Halalkalibacter kiskunsagensis TaxID=1548599 RepID=A0ABV6KF02_9BACI